MTEFGGGAYGQIPPEALQQLMEMGALEDEDAQADEQLQLALALQQPSAQKYSTPSAVGIAGVGDIFKTVSGSARARDARNKKKEISDKRTAGRKRFGDLMGLGGGDGGREMYSQLLRRQGGRAAQAAPDALAASSPFSYGSGAAGGFGYTPGNY